MRSARNEGSVDGPEMVLHEMGDYNNRLVTTNKLITGSHASNNLASSARLALPYRSKAVTHLLSFLMLLSMTTQNNQNLPEEFYRLPVETRTKATLIISGTYGRGRTPCFPRPDGTRVWFIDSWFQLHDVYRGEVGDKHIRINAAMLPKTEFVQQDLKDGQKYLVLLHPQPDNLRSIATKDGLSFWDSLSGDEILAIVELNVR